MSTATHTIKQQLWTSNFCRYRKSRAKKEKGLSWSAYGWKPPVTLKLVYIYTVIYTSTLLSHFDQGSPTFHWPPWHSFHPGWSARNPCHLKASRKDHRTTNLHQPHEVETLWPRALDTINSLTWLVNILFRIASNIWPQTSHHQVMKIYLQDFISQNVKWWRSDSTCA